MKHFVMSVSQIKKQMKLNFITTSVLLGLCAVLVFSCNKDEDFEDFYSLDVNSHTPATRSGMEDIHINNNDEDVKRRNKEFPREQDCCYLTVLMEHWIATKEKQYYDYFSYNCPENAEQHYYTLKYQFKQQYPNWVSGDSVSSTQFMEFAGNEFSGQDIFANSGHSARYYFDDADRRKTVAAIYVQKNEPGRGVIGHIASFVRYYNNIVVFSGEAFCGKKKQMNVDGENGWYITGVILK